MAKSLTTLERFQFSLTGSDANTNSGKRHAIKRHGVDKVTPESVDKLRRENWRLRKQKDGGKTPLFVLAAQAMDSDWKHEPPKGVAVGQVLQCSALQAKNYDAINWGRYRKHLYGVATCFPGGWDGVVTSTNGKSGWDCVVNRYANYGCVVHKNKVAYHIGDGWVVKPVRHNRFVLDGKLVRLQDVFQKPDIDCRYTMRTCLKILQHAGEKAYLTRQTPEMLASGSGQRCRTGVLTLIVDLGELGFYHCWPRSGVRADVRAARAARQADKDKEELESIIARGIANDVMVCAADSYRAGNCQVGTLSWATEHNLDIRKHYTIGEIAELSNGDARFVKAALIAGLRRHRQEMRQGYSVLSEHGIG